MHGAGSAVPTSPAEICVRTDLRKKMRDSVGLVPNYSWLLMPVVS